MKKSEEENKASEQIINTEAAKAKAGEVVDATKKGVNSFVDKVKNDKALLAICCACCAVVVIVLFVLLLGAFNGASKPVKGFSSGMIKQDAKKVCKSFAKDMFEDEDELDECVEGLEESFDEMDSDEKIKSYKIEGKKKLDKDDIEDIAEKLEKAFDIDEKKVKKVVRYKVSFDAKGKDNDTDLYIFSAKIKGRWSIIGISTSKNYSMSGFNF